MTRPYAPANIAYWAGFIERDVDGVVARMGSAEVNIQTAQQGVSSLADAQVNLSAGSNVQESGLSTSVTVGSGWLSNTSTFRRPSISVQSPTGRIEIIYGGAILNGSGRILFSVADSTGLAIIDRDAVLSDYTTALAVTGGASFPSSCFSTRIISTPTDAPVTVTLEVYGAAAGVVLSGANLIVRPTI